MPGTTNETGTITDIHDHLGILGRQPEKEFLHNQNILTGFFLFIGFLGMATFLTYRLAAPPYNFSSGEIGWISFAGITALIAPFAGHFSNKAGIYKIVLAGLMTCLLSFQLMGWFPSITLTALGLLLLFLGVYTVQPLVFLIIGQSVSRDSLGSALATNFPWPLFSK